jgi:hypothetical protein
MVRRTLVSQLEEDAPAAVTELDGDIDKNKKITALDPAAGVRVRWERGVRAQLPLPRRGAAPNSP